MLLSIWLCNQMHICAGMVSKKQASRRAALGWIGSAATVALNGPAAWAEMDVDNYLKSGMVSMPMGVSGQGGKMRPETGVVLREGSDVARNPSNGDVLAEIVVSSAGSESDKLAVLASFSSPWPLATGSVYDVECRDASTGDGAFLAVSSDVKGKSISELGNKFFIDQLFSSTGRFSFYGAPTDIKVKKNPASTDNYKILDIDFSILSQSTNTEVPRKARAIATIPDGSSQAVMLVGSASALRWKKGSEKSITSTVESFRAVTAPTTLKVRAKESSLSL